ncbi:MAG: acyl-CoA dehydratase activase [Nitrospirota bacterium]
MSCYFGVDVGSATTSAVIIGKDGNILDSILFDTYPNHDITVEKIKGFLNDSDYKADYGVSTGYGRKNISIVKKQVSEILCQARGIYLLFPETRVVIDIGGQDNKVIRIDSNGKVLDFVMNDKCAAGTGRFIEMAGRILKLDISNFGAVGLSSGKKYKLNSSCAVFAETEIISLISKKVPIVDIVHGINVSLAEKVYSLLRRIDHKGAYCLCGGMANNDDFVRCLENLIGEEILRPKFPQLTGALGAALIAKSEARQLATVRSQCS